MTRWRYGVVLVGILVVLGGCSSLPMSGGDATDTAVPVTPAPVGSFTATTGGETPSPDAFAAFLDNGTVDFAALTDSHVAYLSNRSFTYVTTQRETTSAEADDPARTVRRVVVNESRYLERVEEPGVSRVEITYVGGGSRYRRVERSGSPPLVEFGGAVYPNPREQFARRVEWAIYRRFVADATRADVVERAGNRYLRLVTRTVPAGLEETFVDYAVRNYSATAWVAPDGYVRTLHFAVELVRGSDRILFEKRFTFRAVGDTTLAEPDWVPEPGTARPGTEKPTEPTSTPMLTSTPAPTPTSKSTPMPSSNGTDAAGGTDAGPATETAFGTFNGTETGPR